MMKMTSRFRLAVFGLFLAGFLVTPGLSLCQDSTKAAPPPPRRTDIIRQRLKDRPNDPTLYYYLGLFEAADGNESASVAALEHVTEIGKGFLPARGLGFDAIWDRPGFQAVYARMDHLLPKVVKARELFRLDKDVIPEGITYDPETKSYFLGSIAEKKIVRVDVKGQVADFSRPGELEHILGLCVDAKGRRLCAVSTSMLTDEGQKTPINRIVAYDLANGTLTGSYPVAAATQLNDVTCGRNGDLYTSDSGAGGVYRIRPDGQVDTLIAARTLPGANGLVLSADGNALYVGHSTGVARVDLAGGKLVPRIDVPQGETIAAIDGLYRDGDFLIGIQNVTNPGRVIRMRLRKDGLGVESVETLLSHHHEAIDEPTTGVIVGRSFALIAASGVGHFTPAGTIGNRETLLPPVVLLVDLK